jgi:hypothetical protein
VLLYPGLEDSPVLNALALVAPLAGGAAQAGFSALSAEDWEEQVGVVGYGRALHPRLALGVDLRSGGWRTEGLSHRAWSADLGGAYEAGWVHARHYLRLSWVARDIIRTSQAAGGQARARPPRTFILGASLGNEARQVLLEVERRAGRTQVRAGYESALPAAEGLQFRVGGNGFTSDWTGGELSGGVGYRWGAWGCDFSYTYPLGPGGVFGGVHRLSLGYRRF